ncbi:hypothetical protein C0992_008677 [Termitomyces sp. T32_za158]|nr:hypothetical protein C0992_008677 [Termitomyces sp. T32_za158]
MGPSVVALRKQCVRGDSEDEDELGPSKWLRSDSGRGESGEGVEGRMVLHAPAPSLPPFSHVFSSISGHVDEAASLCLQNAQLEAANSMLQVEVERCAAQDDLLHAHEVVDAMEEELVRLLVHKGHGGSVPRLVGLHRGAFQELQDAGVQWGGKEDGRAQGSQDERGVVGGGGLLPVDARSWANFGAQWDGGLLADEDPDVLALRRRLGLPVAGGLTAEDLRRDVERQRRWLVARIATSRVSELSASVYYLLQGPRVNAARLDPATPRTAGRRCGHAVVHP